MKHGTWTVGIFERKGHLYDPCNLDSVRKAHHPMTDKVHFEPRGFIYEGAQRAIRFRDGSPLERIQMQIEDAQRRCGYERDFYGRIAFCDQPSNRVAQLRAPFKRPASGTTKCERSSAPIAARAA